MKFGQMLYAGLKLLPQKQQEGCSGFDKNFIEPQSNQNADSR